MRQTLPNTKPNPIGKSISIPSRRILFLCASLLLVLFLILPLVAVVLRVIPNGAEGWLSVSTFDALRLSLVTATLSATLTILLGTPIAYFLSRENFTGKIIIDTL